ncbi:Gim5 protein [Pichia kluyveri]|uniref:Gim5 protein n=1 Tax=Pichia kluyveri TaxID=36015 RepID=A0AAV5R2N0_PICKL|nr:Gim5 protein [Pichia kluyveri]
MSVNLSSLEPQQLMAFKQNTNQELLHLESSYEALILATNKYKDCIKSVKEINNDSKDNEMFIPLTSSLYIKGNNKVNKFKIDIGTGYFIEKDEDESIKFFNKRIEKLNGDSIKLNQLINEKANLLNSIDNIIREKVIAANANKAANTEA